MTGKFLEKYSLGVGDRFAHQAKPQLAACILAARQGVTIVPVWNKSNREHKIVGSEPSGTRAAADGILPRQMPIREVVVGELRVVGDVDEVVEHLLARSADGDRNADGIHDGAQSTRSPPGGRVRLRA